MGSIIRHADDLGLVVILGLFYFGQDEGLADGAAVVSATDAVTDWVLANGWTNVIIEVANEQSPYFLHEILRNLNRSHELVLRVQGRSTAPHLPAGRLLVSTSFLGGVIPPDLTMQSSDFILLHGNGQSVTGIRDMVAAVRGSNSWIDQPIVFNEDSTDLANFEAATAAGAGWGYFNSDQYQSLYSSDEPDRWAVSRAPLYWNKVTEIATSVAPPPPPPSELPELVVSTNSDRSGAILLEGTALTGDVYVFITPDTGVDVATFFLDDPEMIGSPVQIEQNPPFDFKGGSVTTANPFDTLSMADGDHSITVLLVMSSGEAIGVTATFSVVNAEPPTQEDARPTVRITTTRLAAILSGTVLLEAEAIDDFGVATVEFLVDGTTVGVDNQAPFAVFWNTALVPDGPHTLQAIATDSSRQSAGQTITVVVDNSPPELSIAAPLSGESLRGTTQVRADAGDSVSGVVGVTLLVDGVHVGTDALGDDGWSVSWNTSVATDGAHVIQVLATNGVGLTAERNVTVTVNNAVAESLHVSDLDQSSEKLPKGRWAALITALVTSDAGEPVADAEVRGVFRQGDWSLAVSCATDEKGLCTVNAGELPKKGGSAVFTVDAVTHNSLAYDSSANHDPDGDSDGTVITLSKT